MIVAASDSTHRSASTFCISGWSISVLPNAARCAAWCVARATPLRMPVAEPSTQSSRVWLTISMIVGTPRPSSPSMRAQAPSNSTSLEALERFPSLSFRRWRWNRLRVPSGQDARQHEARQAAVGLRQHEEHVAHRRRAEPLVAGDLVFRARSAAVQRHGRPWCWRARPSRPASRSSPCRRASRPCRRRFTSRGS